MSKNNTIKNCCNFLYIILYTLRKKLQLKYISFVNILYNSDFANKNLIL